MNRALLYKLGCTAMARTNLLLCTACVGALAVLACGQSGPGASTGSSPGTSTGNGGATSMSGGANAGGAVSPGGGDNNAGGEQSGGGASSQPDTSNNNTGGTPSAGGTSSSSAGGVVSNVGGAANTSPGNGGSVASGGANPGGGVTSAGGGTKAATGGTKSSAGGGGASATGGSSATGGTKAATGGAPATGGTSAAATTGPIDPKTVVPDLVGFYWEGTCVGTRDPGGHNCPLDDKGSSCPTNSDYDLQGIIRDKVFNVGGTTGQKYTVNFEVAGVVGTRCYQNGTRASTAAPSDSGYNNWWYIGGTQYNNSWWNTYELHVAPTTGDPSGDVYYFNGSDNPGGNYCEREATYLVKYTASFKVLGGGTMTFRLHDSNCQAQQNCGSNTDGTATCAPRTVDLTGFSPQPPSTFKQPPNNVLGSKTDYPQWLFIDVTSVTSP